METFIPTMQMITPAFWAILGLIFMCVEVLAPIAVFLWFGLSALIVALLGWAFHFSPYVLCMLYACVTPLMTWGGRRVFPSTLGRQQSNSHMNNKMDQMVGKVFKTTVDLRGDSVQMSVGNSTWMVTGNQIAAGTTVKIVKLDGVTLHVEACD